MHRLLYFFRSIPNVVNKNKHICDVLNKAKLKLKPWRNFCSNSRENQQGSFILEFPTDLGILGILRIHLCVADPGGTYRTISEGITT